MLAGCIAVVVLLFPVMAPAQDTDAPVDSAIGGDPLPAPVSVRFWNYYDLVDDQNCLDLPLPASGISPAKMPVFQKTFTTNPTTSYIEVIWSGQFTLYPGTREKLGIYFNVYIKQGEPPLIYFPGAGSPGEQGHNPLMVKVDDGGGGQMMFGGFRSVVAAEPNMETDLVVQAFAKIKEATICFQNLTVRYD